MTAGERRVLDRTARGAEPIGLELDPASTFPTFAAGAGDACRFARDLALGAAGVAPSFRVVYLYGPTGAGKTHLLHAVASEIVAQGTSRRVRLISAVDQATWEWVDRAVSEIDVLLVDDVELLAEWVLDAITVAVDRGGAVVVCTADRPPDQLVNASDRLRSRLMAAVVAELPYPDRSARLAILAGLAGRLGVAAPPEVLELVAERITVDDPRALIGAFRRLVAVSMSRHAALDVELAEGCVPEPSRPVPLSPRRIVEATAEALDFPAAEVFGRSRLRTVTAARHTAMFLSRRLTDASYPALARVFGGRDHTTIVSAVEKVDNELREGDAATVGRLEAVLQVLGAGVDATAVWASLGARPGQRSGPRSRGLGRQVVPKQARSASTAASAGGSSTVRGAPGPAAGAGVDPVADALVTLVARGLAPGITNLDHLAMVTGVPVAALQAARGRLHSGRSRPAVKPNPDDSPGPVSGATMAGRAGGR